MLMEVKKIKFSYQDKPFIEDLSVKFKKSKITSIIGPNGRLVSNVYVQFPLTILKYEVLANQ